MASADTSVTENFNNLNNFNLTFSVNNSQGKITALVGSYAVNKSVIDATTVFYVDFENTLIANYSQGASIPSLIGNHSFQSYNGDTCFRPRNGTDFEETDYNKSSILIANTHDFTLEFAFRWYNASVEPTLLFRNTNNWEIDDSVNSNGFTYYDKQNNFYLHSFYNLSDDTDYVLRIVQENRSNHYVQYVFLNNVLVYLGESASITETSVNNPFEINPGSDGDFCVYWIKFSNRSLLPQINGTYSTYKEPLYYSMLESQVYSMENLPAVNMTLTFDAGGNTTGQDSLFIELFGCTSLLKTNCTKSVPFPVQLFEQDGTSDTSAETYHDVAMPVFDEYGYQAAVSLRTSTLNTTNMNDFRARNMTFGVEGDTNNAHSAYFQALRAGSYYPISLFRFYQNTISFSNLFNKSFDFRWLLSEEALYGVTWSPLMTILAANQCNEVLSCYYADIVSNNNNRGLHVSTFHDVTNATWVNLTLNYSLRAAVNATAQHTWSLQELERKLWHPYAVTNVQLEHLANKSHFYYRIYLRGNISLDNLAVTLFNSTGAAGGGSAAQDSLSVSLDRNITSNNSIWINWSVVGNYTNSTVWNNATGTWLALYNGTTQEFNHTGLTNGTTYFYQVNVTFNTTLGNTTGVFFITTNQSIQATPAAPIYSISISSFTCTVISNVSLQLDWALIGNHTYSELRNYTGSTLTLLQNSSSLAYTHTGLLPNTSYNYNLTSYYNITLFNSSTVSCTTEANSAAVSIDVEEEVKMLTMSFLVVAAIAILLYIAKTWDFNLFDNGKNVVKPGIVKVLIYGITLWLVMPLLQLSMEIAADQGYPADMITILELFYQVDMWINWILTVFLCLYFLNNVLLVFGTDLFGGQKHG